MTEIPVAYEIVEFGPQLPEFPDEVVPAFGKTIQ
jgi:hypothetical protein